jgi:hypothetical protein
MCSVPDIIMIRPPLICLHWCVCLKSNHNERQNELWAAGQKLPDLS